MLPRTYDGQNCSIARTLEVVGERWTLLVVRECLEGTRRFDAFQAKLGIARNVLTARLRLLEEEGILTKRAYQEKPTRYEYLLTRKGHDLQPIVLAMMHWGDRHASPAGAPLILRHACGHDLEPACTCASCGEEIGPGTLRARPGPGRGSAPTTRPAGPAPVPPSSPAPQPVLPAAAELVDGQPALVERTVAAQIRRPRPKAAIRS